VRGATRRFDHRLLDLAARQVGRLGQRSDVHVVGEVLPGASSARLKPAT
jgi:hypothetical protein